MSSNHTTGPASQVGNRFAGGVHLNEQDLSVLLSELKEEAANLAEQEGRLAVQELRESMASAKQGLMGILFSVTALVVGATFLLISIGLATSAILAALGVPRDFADPLGFALFGMVAVISALILTKYYKQKLAPSALTPTRTMESLKQTYQWAKTITIK